VSRWPIHARPLLVAAALAAATIAAAPPHGAPALAQHAIEDALSAVRHVKVTRNKSRTFELARPFASAVAGAPEIADVLPMSNTVLYLQGKKAGTTNVSVFDRDKRIIAILEVEVTIDAQQVAEKIRANIESKGITVSSNQEQLILSGYANNAVDAEQASAIAQSTAVG
jgi:pilus assembly protein CpaC